MKEGRGRLLFPAAPDQSLLLLKGAARLPHGGSKRLDPHSSKYRLIRRWIALGMPTGTTSDPTVARIEVHPSGRVMPRGTAQQLLVTAHLLIRPSPGHVWVQPHKQVQMIVQHCEPGDRQREDLGKLLEPILDPPLRSRGPSPSEKARCTQRVPAVIPAGHERINQMGTSDRHGRISWCEPHNQMGRHRRV